MPAATVSVQHERSLSGKRRLGEERSIRNAQKDQSIYFVKKSPFRSLARHLLHVHSPLSKADELTKYQVSRGALETLRHAVERTLGTLIVDANNVRLLATHDERDTVYWTDVLAVLASNHGAPGSLRNWVANEMRVCNDATQKRQLARALSSQLSKHAESNSDSE